jgi:hypothetical protein
MENQNLRFPGQSLDEKLHEILFEKIFIYAVSIMVVFLVVSQEWIRFFFNTIPHPIPITILGVFGVTFCIFKIRKNIYLARNIRQGRDGEREVGQKLEDLRSNGCVVFHDILGPSFNLDHVVVSPHGIFTVETKNYSRKNANTKIEFIEGQVVVNGKHPDRDMIVQSLAQATWLRNILKESTGKEFNVKSVIVFPGWFVDPESQKRAQKEKNVWLLNPTALPSYINNELVILNDQDLHLISYHLARHIRTTIAE